MDRNESVEELHRLIHGPLVMLANSIKDLIVEYRKAETEAREQATAAGTVAAMHTASLRAASAKGAADALQSIVRVIDGATKKGR